MTTRYTDGAVTVTLDDGLDRFVRGLLSKAERATVAVLEEEGRAVADAARREWYGPNGVTRETGLSGQIVAVTTIDSARGEVRVSVGSTDTRKAGKSGKPVPLFVHRPGLASEELVEVSHAEYWATPNASRRQYPKVLRPNPNAGDGKFLVPELLRKPLRARVKIMAGKIATHITGGR